MDEYNKEDFNPQEYAAQRKAEMEELGQALEEGVQTVFQGEGYKQYLDFCAKLPHYSVNNQILIMMQKPDATMCQSFNGWKAMHRTVKRGEKGIRIFAPAPVQVTRSKQVRDANGEVVLNADGEPQTETYRTTIMSFKPVTTFDISQTQGKPVPTFGMDELLGTVEGYEILKEAVMDIVPVPITFEPISNGAKGYYSPTEQKIVVKEGMSDAQTLKTLIHESAHQALHSKDNPDADEKTANQRETEAESVAYIVCKHFGLDTSEYSFPYVATWSQNKEIPELKAALTVIQEFSLDFIRKIEEKSRAIQKSRPKQAEVEKTDAEDNSGDEIDF